MTTPATPIEPALCCGPRCLRSRCTMPDPLIHLGRMYVRQSLILAVRLKPPRHILVTIAGDRPIEIATDTAETANDLFDYIITQWNADA